MRVLSLFDGISCGRVALERAGIPVSRYVAYEIEPNAINCSRWNWPDIEHRGSVVGADFTEFAGFDMVIGGSPCQDLSISNRERAGLGGIKSSLFWDLARALREIQPRYFLVENNKGMPKDAEQTMSNALGVPPLPINSALLSAQQRRRIYWTNIQGVEQPGGNSTKTVQDFLEQSPPASTYTYSGPVTWYPLLGPPRKNGPVRIGNTGDIKHNKQGYRIYSVEGKSICLVASGFGAGGSTGLYKIPCAEGYTIRRLTTRESERLQGLPDGYTEMLTPSAAYSALGNGWQVDTIAHILNYINLDLLV